MPRAKTQERSKKGKLQEDLVRGAKRDLPYGAVKALEQMRHRVPDNVSDPLKVVADLAFQRKVDVMCGKVSFRQAPSVLKAACEVRDEICGPIPREMNIKAQMSLEMLVGRMERDLTDGQAQ